MKVSVIITTYNREKYICSAIDSVLEQTLPADEIIVVDDGSTDNTRKQLTKYSKKITYLYTKNGGPAHARNIGFQHASGEYISWLDSDDLYYPYKLKLQSTILDKFPQLGMIYSEFSAFDDNGFWDEYHLKKYHSPAYASGLNYEDIFNTKISLNHADQECPKDKNINVYKGNIFKEYYNNIIVFTNSIMFRRNVLEKTGLQNENYFLFEELDFALRICKFYEVGFIDVPTYKLRYHPNQISQPKKGDEIQITISKQKQLLKIGKEFGLKDKNFYTSNRELVHSRLAVLHKALAIPLLTKGKKPKLARYHFNQCRHYGYPEPTLQFLTFAPYILRRIAFKGLSLLKLT